ncbi:AraC family transcriptional regulator [Rhizobium sp. BK251]|uniref:AraC family transcriptional regulator n=1 Tax=Rhizobium sp. BK251 TaxID=2512125 RepID=UPI001FE20897|nr:AraC family transcriptional regulator [Rhizobium sp. BK251]
MADSLDVPAGGGAFSLPRVAIGIFLVDQARHRIALGSDRKRQIPLSAGEGWILPAHASGTCEYDEALSYLKLELPDTLLDEVGFENARGFEPLVGRLDPLLAQFAHQMVMNEQAPRSLYRETMELAIAAHLAHLLAPSYPIPARAGDRRLRRAIAYIHDNISADLSLDEMAAEAAISRFHFIRAFTKAFGKSPLQYVIHERMKLARVLLTTTDAPVAVVAARVGYEDPSRFGRHFRRHTGLTPAAFRQSQRS